MIKIRTSDRSALVIEQIRSFPSIYLDLCVLEDIARDAKTRRKFIDILGEKKGTLLFSWVHLIEMFGMDPHGSTFCSIKRLLEDLGNYWGILEANPSHVIQKEKLWKPGQQSPAFDGEFLKSIFLEWKGLEIPTPALALEELQRNVAKRNKYKKLHEEHKTEIKKVIEDERNVYRTNKVAQKKLDMAQYTWTLGIPPTEFIYQSLFREIIKTHEYFRLTDGPDFHHAVVSSAYADIVMLDTKWARRLRKILLPQHAAAKIYDVTALNQFLDDLATLVEK